MINCILQTLTAIASANPTMVQSSIKILICPIGLTCHWDCIARTMLAVQYILKKNVHLTSNFAGLALVRNAPFQRTIETL